MDNLLINKKKQIDVFLTNHNKKFTLYINSISDNLLSINKKATCDICIKQKHEIPLVLKNHIVQIPITINAQNKLSVSEHTKIHQINIPLTINKKYQFDISIKNHMIKIPLNVNSKKYMLLNIEQLIRMWKMKFIYDFNNIVHIIFKSSATSNSKYNINNISRISLRNQSTTHMTIPMNVLSHMTFKNSNSQNYYATFTNSTILISVQHVQDMDSFGINTFDPQALLELERRIT